MPDYEHPLDVNLRDLHRAMELDVSGRPVVRTVSSTGRSDAGAQGAFGENIVSELTPTFQLDGLYGLPTTQFETFEYLGSAQSTGTLMEVKSSTSINGYAVIRSRRAVRYRPGQGAITRFTAKFSAPQPGCTQRAGFFTQEQALQVGYNGSDFGILRQNGGKAHIHKFNIDVVSDGAETLTLTLNDYAIAIPLTTTTIPENAQEIAAAIKADPAGNALWVVEYGNDHVSVLSTSIGPKTGLFEANLPGSIEISNSQAQAGVANTDSWIYQPAFNLDKLDGTGPSGMDLQYNKLNVYQIQFRWLGAGEIRFAIEDPGSGNLIYFHHIHYSNENIDVHLDNPSLKVGYVAANLSGALLAQEVTVAGGSIMGAIEGKIFPTKNPTATSQTSTVNISANIITHILTIKNRTLFQNKINTRDFILKNLNAAFSTSSSAPTVIRVFLDLSTLPDLTYDTLNENLSSVYYSQTQTVVDITNDIPIFVLDVVSSVSQDMQDFDIHVAPGSCLSIVVASTAQITRSGTGITWLED